VNTGWGGGAHGTSKRISLKHTRAIIDAIHTGTLAKTKTQRDPVFGFDVITECPDVPSEILIPRNAWADKAAHDAYQVTPKHQQFAAENKANWKKVRVFDA
jgi:phosphoenolpyruvate carboxykinase (ATP)